MTVLKQPSNSTQTSSFLHAYESAFYSSWSRFAWCIEEHWLRSSYWNKRSSTFNIVFRGTVFTRNNGNCKWKAGNKVLALVCSNMGHRKSDQRKNELWTCESTSRARRWRLQAGSEYRLIASRCLHEKIWLSGHCETKFLTDFAWISKLWQAENQLCYFNLKYSYTSSLSYMYL